MCIRDRAWTGEAFDFEGSGYSARGNRMRPVPTQTPHPPLYIGGNSRRAIRRAVELADGWNPFFTPAALSATARTAAMGNDDDLLEGLKYMREHCDAVDRSEPPEVFLASISRPGDEKNAQQIIDRIGHYRDMGVTGLALNVQGRTRAEWCDNAAWLGAEVIQKV